SGLPIAKHGNRSVSSRCGSADVLEALGAKIDMGPQQARALLDETGFCFLFAPAYHPGMKHAGLVRRQLEVRTIMNLLGPCINPARPPVQLLGVADPKMLRRIAQTLAAMGVEEALVVHGSGLDEVAAAKRADLAARFDGVTLDALRAEAQPTRRSLAAELGRPGARFILEIKKASPSAGAIRPGADPAALARGYAGIADALSVL